MMVAVRSRVETEMRCFRAKSTSIRLVRNRLLSWRAAANSSRPRPVGSRGGEGSAGRGARRDRLGGAMPVSRTDEGLGGARMPGIRGGGR